MSNFSHASLQTDRSWKDTLYIFLRLRADGITSFDTSFDDESDDEDVNCVAVWIIQENLIRHELGNGTIPPDLVSLAQERIRVLDSMKFPWKMSHAERKKTNIEALIAFKEKNGHCRVPQRQQNLGRYVNNLREDYKLYSRDPSSCKHLTKDLVDQLNSLGFEWAIKKPCEENWNDKYGMLLEFRQENNHCDVPRSTKLGRWVAEQRKYYKKKDVKNLGQGKIDKLEKIGFKWKAN
eukprot:CCRYP_012600-RA/>CCRYP_012600-RA protein AED:0.17 eAED:0.14 QI:0/0/0/0.5/1/1/2/0/235